jgi:hypothetical protein
LLDIKQRKDRTFEEIKSIDDVLEILKSHFQNKKIRLKYSAVNSEVQINEFFDDKSFTVITDTDFNPEGDLITLYVLLDKYLEIDLLIEEVRAPGYFRCRIAVVRKAISGRKDLRFKVKAEDVVATNFKFSKYTIDLSGYKIPTSIKVILDQFQSQNSGLSDIVKVDIFNPGDPMLDEVKKTAKVIYIEDTNNPETFKPLTDDFIDIRELLGEELTKVIKRFTERSYRSLIICPLIYITDLEQSITFGYIQLISKGNTFSLDKVLEIKENALKLVDRIRKANTLLAPVHQSIVDISKGGVKLKITDENLKKYLIKARGFIFDIVFKLQAPITIYGEIRYTNYDASGNLFLGIDFSGNSSRKNEMKRYYSIIKPMELDYKTRLVKEIRQKKKADSA